MNDRTKRWTVVLDVGVDAQGDTVHAVARLHDRSSDHTVGTGDALLGPVERNDPAIGHDIAAARALAQLSRRLLARAQTRYRSAPVPAASFPAPRAHAESHVSV